MCQFTIWGWQPKKKQKKNLAQESEKLGKACFFVVFCLFLFFLLTILRCSNNFKRFKKYPDTIHLLYDQGETSNQHLIITKEYNIYVKRVS